MDTVAANPAKVTESLITPTGKEWWKFVTSQAADTNLWNHPTPTAANWYGMTTGETQKPIPVGPGLHALSRVYHTLHIGFPTAKAARAYTETLPDTDGGTYRAALRHNILTLTSPWVDPEAEPFPGGAAATATGATLKPRAAAWSINLGKQNASIADQAPNPKWADALHTAYTHLGYTATTHWNAVSATPQGPWTGTLTGYNPDTIDLLGVSEALASTMVYDCPSDDDCTETDRGLTAIYDHNDWSTTEGSLGRDSQEGDQPAPPGSLLAFNTNTTATLGVVARTESAPVGPYTSAYGRITPTQTVGVANLVVTFAEDTTPTLTAVPAKPTKEDTDNGVNPDYALDPSPGPAQPKPGDPIDPVKVKPGTPLATPSAPVDPDHPAVDPNMPRPPKPTATLRH